MENKLYNKDLAKIYNEEVLNEVFTYDNTRDYGKEMIEKSNLDKFSVENDSEGIERITSSSPELEELAEKLKNLNAQITDIYNFAKNQNTRISMDIAMTLDEIQNTLGDAIVHHDIYDIEY